MQMQIYMTKLKNIHKKKMRLVSHYIIQKMRNKIVRMEYTKLWNKVQPFFLKLLAVKRNRQISNKAHNEIMAEKYSRSMKIIQFNLLQKKMKERKEKIKYIFNYSSTKIFSKYYINLIKNVLVIQKYINVNLSQKKIINQLNKDYFIEEPKSILMTEYKDAGETLFPLALETEFNEDETLNNNNNQNHNQKFRNKNNNFDKNSTINNKDNSFLRTAKPNDFKGKTISDNKSPYITTTDKSRNLNRTKYNDKNNNTLNNKTSSTNNTIGYNNKNYLNSFYCYIQLYY